MQYGAGGRILRVGGMVAPGLTRGDRNTSGYEDRRPRTSTRTADMSPSEALTYWNEQITLNRPALDVDGCCVPYGTVVELPRLGPCRFSIRTVWDFPAKGLELRGNHCRSLGWVKVTESAGGLSVHGTIPRPMRDLIPGTWLSPAFQITADHDDRGVRVVDAARLDEVSLVDKGVLYPFTYARLTEARASVS